MKILAQIDRDNYIVTATRDELAKCQGYAYGSSLPAASQLCVGAAIEVTEAYETTSALLNCNRQVKEARDKVQHFLNVLDKLTAVVDPKAQVIKAKLPS